MQQLRAVNVGTNNSQAITIDDNSMDSVTAATAVLAFTENAAGNTISTRVLSFTKQTAGAAGADEQDGQDGADGQDGSDGVNAAAVRLVPSSQAILFDQAGNESTSISFTTDVQNVIPHYQFLVDDVSKQNSTTSTFTLADSDEPAVENLKRSFS